MNQTNKWYVVTGDGFYDIDDEILSSRPMAPIVYVSENREILAEIVPINRLMGADHIRLYSYKERLFFDIHCAIYAANCDILL